MPEQPQDAIYTHLQALVRLRHTAGGFSYLPRQPVNSLLAGRKRSKLRGRGLDFDELRHYRPGDDIRTMDWRVTNRTGKPHVRVYTEERDRPVIVIVDQRLPMFFGSQYKMKSVVAAEVAAITAWRVLGVGDRIGAILFNDERVHEARPSRSDNKVMGWLGDLATMNQQLSVNSGTRTRPEALLDALKTAERQVSHDYLVILVSDFHGWNQDAMAHIRRIARHNDIICSLVFDPLERDISSAEKLVVSDGYYQLELDPAHNALGDRFEASFESSFARVRADLTRHQIPVIPIDTATSAARQLREKLGGQGVLV
ncbi:DUF58 domain-containing protein [Seongchinamella sediminis]|uniref:DUF58 domain-containing protein n=1 Tax=Seongchinamella sediminis TaxID=2283635 RepID=A0A3L7DYT1_9GAMM|nr:DUF58 domain-containing protein [Seongchinamella sediminis]RLQ21819.1 DUF58 domain-containing protein [Seongchinamella sediminis]